LHVHDDLGRVLFEELAVYAPDHSRRSGPIAGVAEAEREA